MIELISDHSMSDVRAVTFSAVCLQEMLQQQPDQQQQQMRLLASAAEVAAAQSYLQSQGNATQLLPTTGCCLCLSSTPYSASNYGHAADGSNPAQHPQQQMQPEVSEVVVPLSARSEQLSMAKLLQIMHCVPQAAAAPADNSVHEACMREATAAAGDGTGRGVSLAIVDGVDVVQVKLFAGIQPPSESY
jgi:hypothetical protein